MPKARPSMPTATAPVTKFFLNSLLEMVGMFSFIEILLVRFT
jgi:hypothetical protein